MKYISFFLLYFLYSCNNKPSTAIKNISAKSKSAQNDSFILGYFDKIPDTVDGCGDYYELQGAKNNRYVFLSRMSEIGLIKLNGITHYLNYQENINSENQKYFRDVYLNDSIKIILDVVRTKDYEEGGFYKGNMIIEYKNIIDTVQVEGQSGC